MAAVTWRRVTAAFLVSAAAFAVTLLAPVSPVEGGLSHAKLLKLGVGFLVPADMNGDGNQDLVVRDFNAATFRIVFGDGHGGFRPSGHSSPKIKGHPGPLEVADVDGDGDLDVLVGETSGETYGVRILRNKGGGRLPLIGAVKTRGRIDDILARDLNNDGVRDLILSHRSGILSIALGHSNGGFGKVREYGNTGAFGRSVVSADFDRDGDLDVAAAYAEGVVGIYLNRGVGRLDPPVYVDGGTQSTVRDLVAGRFNGDRFPDIAFVGRRYEDDDVGVLVVALGNGDGTFTEIQRKVIGRYVYYIESFKFNRDRFPDLALTEFPEGPRAVQVFRGTRSGQFKRARQVPLPKVPCDVIRGRLNGDNRDDLIVEHCLSGAIMVLLGK